MPRIRLTWEEVSGDLPMVCPFCGDDADVLVTEQMKEAGSRHRILWTVHRIADVTLPRCRRHRRVWKHLFTFHLLWIETDYIEFRNAHQDFIDAVEDYRERPIRRRDRNREEDREGGPRRRDRDDDRNDDREDRPRRRRRRPESNTGWIVALLVIGALTLAAVVPCLCLMPYLVVVNQGPQKQNQQRPAPNVPRPGQPPWR